MYLELSILSPEFDALECDGVGFTGKQVDDEQLAAEGAFDTGQYFYRLVNLQGGQHGGSGRGVAEENFGAPPVALCGGAVNGGKEGPAGLNYRQLPHQPGNGRVNQGDFQLIPGIESGADIKESRFISENQLVFYTPKMLYFADLEKSVIYTYKLDGVTSIQLNNTGVSFTKPKPGHDNTMLYYTMSYESIFGK